MVSPRPGMEEEEGAITLRLMLGVSPVSKPRKLLSLNHGPVDVRAGTDPVATAGIVPPRPLISPEAPRSTYEKLLLDSVKPGFRRMLPVIRKPPMPPRMYLGPFLVLAISTGSNVCIARAW